MKKRYLLAAPLAVAGIAIAAKILSRAEDVSWRDHAGELPHAEHSWFTEIDGIRIHYMDAGPVDAPAVVLVHGFCASGVVWKDVLPLLVSAGLRVIVPDLVGFGFSAKPGWASYTIEMQARVLVHLLDALKLDQVTLVGSSYGGAVSATIALDYPQRVTRLVMVDAVTNDAAKSQMLMRLARTPLLGDIVCPLVIDARPLVRWRLKQIYAPENAHVLTEARLESYCRTMRSASAHRAALKTARHWHANRIEHDAGRIHQPALLIWGELDPDIPLAHGERLHALIPNSRLAVFRNCGHMPQEEVPEKFTELLAEFCGSRIERPTNYGTGEIIDHTSRAALDS